MPWKATDAMKEKVNLVLEWERRWHDAQGGAVDMAELCRKYGVGPPTGYAWVKRFRDANHDVRAVEEKSRRPALESAGDPARGRELARPGAQGDAEARAAQAAGHSGRAESRHRVAEHELIGNIL